MRAYRSEGAQTKTVTITVDARPCVVPADASVAAALLTAGVDAFRRSVTGESRAPLCGMGICYECRVTIDEITNRRACLVPVAEGMHVRTSAAKETPR